MLDKRGTGAVKFAGIDFDWADPPDWVLQDYQCKIEWTEDGLVGVM